MLDECLNNVDNDAPLYGKGGRDITRGAEHVEAAVSTVTLPKEVLNKLYLKYSIKQRTAGLTWFLLASVLFDTWALIIFQGQCIEALVVTTVVLCVNIVFCITLGLSNYLNSRKQQDSCISLTYLPHSAWALSILHFVLYFYIQKNVSAREALGWSILLNFLIYVTLPIPMFFAVLTPLIYFCTLITTARRDPLIVEQILANVLLTLTAAAIGLLCYFLDEDKQKRAFLEAKSSLEVKMIIEEQSAEQERLLLSVLPKHVAEKMRQDLGSTSSEPFKKIYMCRHENVSILYADIVGFTAISSTYNAQDLVKMLNELFARFDRLAEKYHQLRIKILGDCYYCISGAPDERPDHAILCVLMGLSMVKAIKYVQQKTHSPVDMRVGIHTGAVLAGILGQRQWQFDVYSKDVELANKMESSGKAGRVHISNQTLAYLDGHFEVEPALGEAREEALRVAGLKTYFITKMLKPFSSDINSLTKFSNGDLQDEDLYPEISAENNQKPGAVENEERKNDFLERLQRELIARDGHSNLSKGTTVFLKFKRQDFEALYSLHREPYSSVPLVAALLVQCLDILLSFIILPRSFLHLINITTPLIPIFMLVFISVSESFPQYIPSYFVNMSKRFNNIIYLRELAAIVIAITIGFSNIVDMYFFANIVKNYIDPEETANLTSGNVSNTLADYYFTDSPPTRSDIVLYPSYISNFGVLILIAIAVIAQLTHVTKIFLLIAITASHCYCNVYIKNEFFTVEDHLSKYPVVSTSYSVSGILLMAAVALSFLARHMDREDRVIFMWKTEVAEQKEMAKDMRQRNEALVYNVLPIHVAEYFMKNTKRSYDDLYSQSYSEVGVLFASMPNFADFYSEESINNQGLECLRFLNEVISDFDALLELPQFQDIIKIKTIGSTYMAASGINLAHSQSHNFPQKRWTHLDSLVEFAMELKKALQSINEQSFNHFALKMGINHGPITAGVIGARKPHYDIWGNTVNVASRMESTGKAGAIQVTEETCKILEQFGYEFQQRGLISVKGKGQLMTYYLQGKSLKPVMVNRSHKQASNVVPQIKHTSLYSSTSQDTSTSAKYKLNATINKPYSEEKDSESLAAPSSVKVNAQQGKPDRIFEDVEVDIKAPLLQKNSSNAMPNGKENDDRENMLLIE